MSSNSNTNIDSITDKLQLLHNNKQISADDMRNELMPLERRTNEFQVIVDQSDRLNQQKIKENVELIQRIHKNIQVKAESERFKSNIKKCVGGSLVVLFLVGGLVYVYKSWK